MLRLSLWEAGAMQFLWLNAGVFWGSLRAHETELSLLCFHQAQPGAGISGHKISQPVLPSCAKNILCLTAFWVAGIF